MPKNLGKIFESLGKISENPVKYNAQRCLTWKNGAQSLQANTWSSFFGGHTKKGLHDLCGSKFVGKSRTKTFRTSLGKFGQKSFATPKIFLFLHLWDAEILFGVGAGAESQKWDSVHLWCSFRPRVRNIVVEAVRYVNNGSVWEHTVTIQFLFFCLLWAHSIVFFTSFEAKRLPPCRVQVRHQVWFMGGTRNNGDIRGGSKGGDWGDSPSWNLRK